MCEYIQMKRILFIVISAVVLASCGNNPQKEIEKNAYGYLDAMGNYRIDDARPYASTPTCERTLDVLQKYILPKTDTNYIISNTPATIDILGVELLSDTTAVVSYSKTTPLQVQSGKLDMVKEGARWCAEVIINLPPIMTMDSTQMENNLSARLDSLKGKPLRAVSAEEIKKINNK